MYFAWISHPDYMLLTLQHTVIAGQNDSQPYYLQYKQCLLGDQNGHIVQEQIASLANDRKGWMKLIVACAAASR